MSDKLTATLSDGSEWEVDILGGQPSGDMHVNLKPLKREPTYSWKGYVAIIYKDAPGYVGPMPKPKEDSDT